MRERQQLDDQMSSVTQVETDLNDAIDLIELGEMEDDADVVAEAEAGLADMLEMIARKQVETLLSGEADGNDAYIEVHSGAGGTESQDWASMLMRMYTRWAEQQLQG